jgi:hypothetical protein
MRQQTLLRIGSPAQWGRGDEQVVAIVNAATMMLKAIAESRTIVKVFQIESMAINRIR